ncbi:Uncharacterized protein involved in outer membrane biogenesis [Elusimicrobium minutum Pei191]|uniref:Uncharacterized protein involved in outer membrane biogenesis n=1 Tax=Elusimicrobium minutum (strain Pei191) TaxID=445932 RepID=B2KD13_ELUMP|nr:AsmA family protein [Elusimicrobium minutum]ACC98409.1 Uncharacterized protein involved in outer membrane biogenesis [Elusimicrobium minutum Pei191]
MKKLLKIAAVLFLIAVIAVAGAAIALRQIFTPEKIKNIITTYAKTNYNREVSFDKLSFKLIGVELSNFAMSEAGTFKNGTFAKADSMVIKIALRPLFKKSIEVSTIGLDGFNSNIIKDEKGNFNFDDLIPAADVASSAQPKTPKEIEEQGLSFNVQVDKFFILNSAINYTDKKEKMTAQIKDVNVKINDFVLDGPFAVNSDFRLLYNAQDMAVDMPVSVNLMADLKNNNLDAAELTLKSLTASLNGITTNFQGTVKGFNNPIISVSGTVNNVNNKTLSSFVSDLPDFSLPAVKLASDIKLNLDKSNAEISKYSASLTKSTVNGSANVSFGGKDLVYNAKANLKLFVDELAAIAPELTKEYGLQGTVTGSLSASDPDKVTGKITLENVGAAYQNVVTVKDINGIIQILGMTNIKSETITGKINDAAFKTTLAFSEKKTNHYAVNFDFDLDSLTIKELPKTETSEAAKTSDAVPSPSAKSKKATGPYIDLKTNVKIGPVSVPHFNSKGASLTADLTSIEDTLTTLSGKTQFRVEQGEITDIKQFLASNKIINVMFISIGIVKKVFDVLKLDVFTSSNKKDAVPFELIEGDYSFNSGLMTINKTTLSSDLTTVKAEGTIDFKTDKLNMKVNAHLGKQGSSGFKPVAIKVGGTIDNPKATIDVLSTATSIVPGVATLGKNTVSGATNTAKDVVSGTVGTALKGIGGLLKKDTKEEEESK